MTIEEELTLSYYKVVADLDKDHGVLLVQHQETGRIYVKKTLSVYSLAVYQYLISHHLPGTPRIYEAIEDGEGHLEVIEEYVGGTTLSSILKKGSLSEEEALQILSQLCPILSSLHSCTPPIIHRDIKPSNILVTDEGKLYLLDFNAAKQDLGKPGRDTQLIGTAGFAAPEQYGFGSSSMQTDIYALGVLLAEMRYGSFSREALSKSRYDRVIEKCTRLVPEQRFSSAEALLSASGVRPGEGGLRIREPRDIRRLLPPGLGSGPAWKVCLSLAGYGFLCWLCHRLRFGSLEGAGLRVARMATFLSAMTPILFGGNYLGIQERVGIPKIRLRPVRAIAIIAGMLYCFWNTFLLVLVVSLSVGG